MSNVTREQAAKIAIDLRAKGKNYSDIAQHLAKIGHKTGRGTVPTAGYVWAFIPENNSPTRKKINKSAWKTGAKKAPTAGFTKWDLMKAIDQCGELKTPTKKALIQLLLQEFYQ